MRDATNLHVKELRAHRSDRIVEVALSIGIPVDVAEDKTFRVLRFGEARSFT
jgi:hypothetical protein